MNHLVKEAGLSDQILCDSAGTSAYHIGESPDPRMSAAARRKGIPLNSQGRKFEAIDFEKFDLILAMDKDNYQAILARDSTGQHHPKVRMMCDFCQTFPDKEVPDPYYGGSDGFNYVIELLLDACNGLLTHVTQEMMSANPH
jgi:protein-tyrosine phosphatase